MKQMFIGKAIQYAASKGSATLNTALTPDLLADGAIGIYGILSTGLITLLTATATGTGLTAIGSYTGDRVFIAQGTPKGAVVTDTLRVNELTRVLKNEYAAHTAGVVTITPTMPGATTKYDFYYVKMQDMSDPNRYYWDYEVQGVFANATAMNDALRTKINNDPLSPVVASGTTTLILTDKVAGRVLEYALGGTSLLPADLVYTTRPTKGSGNGADIVASEKLHSTHRGYLNTADAHITKAPQFASVTGTYDHVILREVKGASLGQAHKTTDYRTEDREYIIAFPDGAYIAGNAEHDTLTILDALTTIETGTGVATS